MNKIVYPLKQIIEVKQRRVDEAEKVVKEKQQLLVKEQDKLKEREAARDKELNHHAAKLKQIRDALDAVMTTDKIQQMKVYLKIVKERLLLEEKKVKDQKAQVEIAEKNLEAARQDLKKKRMDVDKLLTHRKDWEKEMRKEQEVIEGREQDEMGNIIFSIHHRKK